MPDKAATHKPLRPLKSSEANTPAQVEARRIRSGRQWAKLRKMVLSKAPICPGLWHGDQVVLAREVHHIQPLVDRPDLAYHLSNLVALCSFCHSRVEGEGGMDLILAEAQKKLGFQKKRG